MKRLILTLILFKIPQTGAVGILVNAETIEVKLAVKGYVKELSFQESAINASQKN
ncbi:hypothetical protein ACOBV8_18680 (plasmid) [Pseudoalteromonas espejiana]